MKNIDKYLSKDREYNKDRTEIKKDYDKSSTEDPEKKKRLDEECFVREVKREGKIIFYDYQLIKVFHIFCGSLFIFSIFFLSFISHSDIITNNEYLMLIVVFILLGSIFFIGFGFCSQYSFFLNHKELVKEYIFYGLNYIRTIAEYSDIKLIGVSTEYKVKMEIARTHKSDPGKTVCYIEVKNKIIAVIAESNKIIVLEEGPSAIYSKAMEKETDALDVLNKRALAASKIAECAYIPGDGSSRIEIRKGNYDKVNDSLVMLIPKEEQVPEIDFKCDTYFELN